MGASRARGVEAERPPHLLAAVGPIAFAVALDEPLESMERQLMNPGRNRVAEHSEDSIEEEMNQPRMHDNLRATADARPDADDM